jgi:hypothetical protein
MTSVNSYTREQDIAITRVRWQDDLLANTCISLDDEKWENALLTPDSPDLAIVREQIPLHASQNLIS